MNYSWEIHSTGARSVVNSDGDTLSNAVVEITWSKTGTDDEDVSATYKGTTTVDASNTPSSDFIAFSDLTKEKLIEWVEGALSADDVAQINKVIGIKINKQKEPAF